MPRTRSAKKDELFKRRCTALIHEEDEEESDVFINVIKPKKIKKQTASSMINEGIIPSNARTVCKACVRKYENRNCQTKQTQELANEDDEGSDSDKAKGEVTKEKGEILEEVKPTEMRTEESEMQTKHDQQDEICKGIKDDIRRLYNDKSKCKIESLLEYNPIAWLEDRPKDLVKNIASFCGIKEHMIKEEKNAFRIAKVIESIYGCQNSKLVLPIGLSENLLTYSCSHSKQLVNYHASVEPSGAYSYLSRWMTDQSSSPVTIPKGLVRCVFDNEQVIGKTRTIRAENKVPSSVITSHAYISMDPDNNIQKDHELSPKQWLFECNPEHVTAQVTSDMDECVKLFRCTRDGHIDKRLAAVLDDIRDNSDTVDSLITHERKVNEEKFCDMCGAVNDAALRLCTDKDCRGTLSKHTYSGKAMCSGKESIDAYDGFAELEVKENHARIYVGEPDFQNPNSYANIATILRNLGERAGITEYGGSERCWIFLECDGAIYSIVENLVFNVWKCTECEESYYLRDAFDNHICAKYIQRQGYREFSWIVMIPGLLHIEMKACKAFIDLNWNIFGLECAKALSFKSPKALEYIRRCSDHHKSMRFCEIMYLAFTDELLLPYVRYCASRQEMPTADGYWLWAESVKSYRYKYLQQMTFTFLHAIMLMRAGARKGNAEALHAGIWKFAPLLYARKHPFYKRILGLHKYVLAQMPLRVKNDLMKCLTVSRTSNVGHYQGGDAMLEEINKEAKAWISPIGVPTDQHWLKVFRNLDQLNQVKNSLLQITESSQAEKWSGTSDVGFQEVAEVRKLVRGNQFLDNTSDEGTLKDITGETPLILELVNFSILASEWENEYFTAMLNEEEVEKKILAVTEEERLAQEQVESLSKPNIEKLIREHLRGMDEVASKLYEDRFNKTVLRKNKQQFIDFYYEILNVSVNDEQSAQ